MKIQINSLEALERLINGDTDVEIEVRNSVVQAFTKKHLKALATAEVLTEIKKALVKEIRDEFLTEIKGNFYSGNTWKFKESNDAVKQLKDELLREYSKQVKNEMLSSESVKALDEQIKTSADFIASQLQQTVLEKRLDAMVDAKIKEKLGVK